ncbi:MAG: HAMP domain-containing histidine kinase [Spirochaetales bacterium]|jgi:signal transduction histidine kinase|nr:HAMP domain-containing histidine kinase [Spirochaetales bacterium]
MDNLASAQDALLREKSQFILQVTHELRGPIAALLGYHEMILKGITGEITSETRSTLTRANLRTQRLLAIVDEMLDFARMESEEPGKSQSKFSSIRKEIQTIFEQYASEAKERDVNLINQVPEQSDFDANRDLFHMVFCNLLTNAIKYSPSGGNVTVTASPREGGVKIGVEDEGMGIEREEINRIFEDFYRSRRARVLDDAGTGLGLSIARKAASSLNGHICVKSEPGSGSIFYVCLPLSGNSSDFTPDECCEKS